MFLLAKDKRISPAVIRRLPRYYRYLGDLLNNEIYRISSKELSERMGVTASQIRQDLNNFGGFGQQGYGYNVEYLYSEIGKILGLNRTYTAIIVGVGNLGQALANYTKFERRGTQIIGLFDINPKLIGLKIRDVKISDVDELEEFIKENHIDIAILTTPKEKTPELAENMVKWGIKAIWNFSPVDLRLGNDVLIENVHLSDHLMTLTYKLNQLNSGRIIEEEPEE